MTIIVIVSRHYGARTKVSDHVTAIHVPNYSVIEATAYAHRLK